jgi:hypothetical protein
VLNWWHTISTLIKKKPWYATKLTIESNSNVGILSRYVWENNGAY